jgi:hypothetical protein
VAKPPVATARPRKATNINVNITTH